MASFDEKYPIVEDEESQSFNDSDYPVVDYGFNEAPREPPVDFSAMEMMRNVPSSARNYGESLYNTVMHPIETAKGVGNLAMGTAQKAIPGEQDKEVYADMMGQLIKDRYGSWDKFKYTLMTDPVGAIGDISLALSGAGGAVKAGGRVAQIGNATSKAANFANKAGTAVAKTGMAIDPLNLALNTGKAALIAPMKTETLKYLPNSLYQKGAKLSGTLDETIKNTQTAMDNNLFATVKGHNKIGKMIKTFESQLSDVIKKSPNADWTVDAHVLLAHVDTMKDQLGGLKINARQDIRRMNKLLNAFKKHIKEEGKSRYTPAELQQFKTDAYKKIQWKPGKKPVSDARKVVNQQTARAAKDFINELIPETKPINEKLGPLYELQGRLDPAAKTRMGSNQSIRGPINAAAGALIAEQAIPGSGGWGAAAGAGLSLLENPSVLQGTGMLLNRFKNQGILGGYAANSPLLYALRQGAITGEELNSLLGQQ